MKEPVHIISLGAGVQSSTMALMAAAGEIGPMPTAAIFADTQAEPKAVYDWLDWLEKQLPFPVIRVTAGNLTEKAAEIRVSQEGVAHYKVRLPFHTLAADGKRGMIRGRACTSDFKIVPILKAVRSIAGIKRGQKEVGAISWIGISLDEVQRMKPSREPWCEHRWPLVDLRMSRHDCLRWMGAKGFPKPPRSSCIFCPYHSNAEWRNLTPEEFRQAVEFEKAIQDAREVGVHGRRNTSFLHRSCVPLDQVDLSTDVERWQGELWGNECEGMCGV